MKLLGARCKLLDNLVRKGYIIRRQGKRNWIRDSYDLTIKAEKTLEEYKKIWGIRGGSRPSAGHQGR
jgi:DNA-binding PadR family transcriptional regulator